MKTKETLEMHLRMLEESLLLGDVRRSTNKIAELLSGNFIEFGSSGRIYDRQQVIEALKADSVDKLTLLDFRALMLSPGVVLVTYLAVRENAENKKTSYSLRSSLWKNNEGRWQIVFHQGTPVEEGRTRDEE